jgi:hypothetical protein
MKLTVYEATWLLKKWETAENEGRLAQLVMPNGKMLSACKPSYLAAVARDILKIVAQIANSANVNTAN